jgi:hypothetical protein
MQRRCGFLLRASQEQTIGGRRLRKDLRGRRVDIGSLAGARAVNVRRQHTRGRIENDREVHPLIFDNRLGRRFAADFAADDD